MHPPTSISMSRPRTTWWERPAAATRGAAARLVRCVRAAGRCRARLDDRPGVAASAVASPSSAPSMPPRSRRPPRRRADATIRVAVGSPAASRRGSGHRRRRRSAAGGDRTRAARARPGTSASRRQRSRCGRRRRHRPRPAAAWPARRRCAPRPDRQGDPRELAARRRLGERRRRQAGIRGDQQRQGVASAAPISAESSAGSSFASSMPRSASSASTSRRTAAARPSGARQLRGRRLRTPLGRVHLHWSSASRLRRLRRAGRARARPPPARPRRRSTARAAARARRMRPADPRSTPAARDRPRARRGRRAARSLPPAGRCRTSLSSRRASPAGGSMSSTPPTSSGRAAGEQLRALAVVGVRATPEARRGCARIVEVAQPLPFLGQAVALAWLGSQRGDHLDQPLQLRPPPLGIARRLALSLELRPARAEGRPAARPSPAALARGRRSRRAGRGRGPDAPSAAPRAANEISSRRSPIACRSARAQAGPRQARGCGPRGTGGGRRQASPRPRAAGDDGLQRVVGEELLGHSELGLDVRLVPVAPTISADGCPPAIRPMACASIVLPAPVSPVSTFRPGSSSSSACSIRARFSIGGAATRALQYGSRGTAAGCNKGV